MQLLLIIVIALFNQKVANFFNYFKKKSDLYRSFKSKQG